MKLNWVIRKSGTPTASDLAMPQGQGSALGIDTTADKPYYLKSDGSVAPLAGSGSTVLLATKTAASSATIDFTQFNSSLYASYLITIDNLVFSANARLWGYVSTDGGATWDSGANYDDNIFISTSSATATLVTAQTKLWFSGLMKGASATYANSCRIELADPSLTTGYRQILCRMAGYDSTPTYNNVLSTCVWKNTSSAYNALRLFPDAGTFTSGIFKLYGLAK